MEYTTCTIQRNSYSASVIVRFTIPKNFPARKERTDYFESMRSSKLCYPMDYPPMKLW